MPETSEIDVLRKQVEERAYALWEGEGRPDGRHLDHWLQAEAEITPGGGAADGSSPPSPMAPPGGRREKQTRA